MEKNRRILRQSFCVAAVKEDSQFRSFLCQSQKGLTKPENRTNSTKEFSEQLEGWEAVGLGNRLKRENSQKCLGEGAKGPLDPGSKGLRKVFCTTQNWFCTGAKWGCTGAKGFVLPESKRPFAPSPKDFWEFSLFGQFPRPAASQLEGVTRPLPSKPRILRQIAPESSPELSAKSLSHSFFVVPFLSPIVAEDSLPMLQCLLAYGCSPQSVPEPQRAKGTQISEP